MSGIGQNTRIRVVLRLVGAVALVAGLSACAIPPAISRVNSAVDGKPQPHPQPLLVPVVAKGMAVRSPPTQGLADSKPHPAKARGTAQSQQKKSGYPLFLVR